MLFLFTLISMNIAIHELINFEVSYLLVAIQTMVTITISYYIGKSLSMAKAVIKLSVLGYEHHWERKFLFSWEKGVLIRWEEIESYLFRMDRSFDVFSLNLTGKRRYSIERLNITKINDDFDALLKDFPKVSNAFLKKTATTKPREIGVGKSIYEESSFKWMIYLYGVFFIILLVTKIIDPVGGTPWGPLGVIGSTFFFYAWMIYTHAKKQ